MKKAKKPKQKQRDVVFSIKGEYEIYNTPQELAVHAGASSGDKIEVWKLAEIRTFFNEPILK